MTAVRLHPLPLVALLLCSPVVSSVLYVGAEAILGVPMLSKLDIVIDSARSRLYVITEPTESRTSHLITHLQHSSRSRPDTTQNEQNKWSCVVM